jgi:hypothetical protein
LRNFAKSTTAISRKSLKNLRKSATAMTHPRIVSDKEELQMSEKYTTVSSASAADADVNTESKRIKIICRMQDGRCIRTIAASDVATEKMQHTAEYFLSAFSPEHLLSESSARYGEDFVLVFRTDETQMCAFHAELTAHGGIADKETVS